MNKLYVVIPCYNEEEVLKETAKRIKKKMNELRNKKLIHRDSHVVFINDGSKIKLGKSSLLLLKKILYLVELVYREIEDIKMHYWLD